MNFPRIRAKLPPFPRKGSAILIMLTVVTLITVLVISLLITSRLERNASALALTRARSETLADYTADLAMARLREAIDAGRTLDLPGYNLWASEPGRIHLATVSNTGEISQTAREMYSGLPGKDDAKTPDLNNVDLNKAALNGLRPITGNQPGTMKVGWINFLANPGQLPSDSNPLVARVAYWVDDESCKVNVNTADGSDKYTPDSFGFGTPSEINLQGLPSGIGTNLSKSQAKAISTYAWAQEFNSLQEIKRVPTLPPDFLETNLFNLTTRSRTPELTFFGEPRIYLFPVSKLAAGTIRSCLTGGYGTTSTDASVLLSSSDIDFVYPTSAQLPKMMVLDTNEDNKWDNKDLESLTQFAPNFSSGNITITALNYHFAARIARGIKGINSQNVPFMWPAFADTTIGAFDAKYNDRQIDSIALTIVDTATVVAALVNTAHNFPSVATSGMLSKQTVIGIGRMPRITELRALIDTGNTGTFQSVDPAGAKPSVSTSNLPYIQMDMELEYYLPKYFAGSRGGYTDFQFGSEGGHSQHGINQNDHDGRDYEYNEATGKWDIPVSYPTKMGGYWEDNLLTFVDGNNPAELAGIDLRAHARNRLDPEDSAKRAKYHPFAPFGEGGSSYAPTKESNPLFDSTLQFPSPTDEDIYWAPGVYHGMQTANQGALRLYFNPTVTSLKLKGGASVWGRNVSGATSWETAPLESLRGVSTDPTLKAKLKEMVIPVPADLVIPIPTPLDEPSVWHARVADPLVNKFPGDWIVTANPPDSVVTIKSRRYPNMSYLSGGYSSTANPFPTGDVPSYATWFSNIDGDNPETRPSGGGDPLTMWLPRQDYAYPKQSRFPSVGALNFLRTGVIPDDLNAPLIEQKGVPWRTINLASTLSPGQSITVNSNTATYPDWAMLDLFTVPFTPQKPYVTTSAPDPIPPIRTLSSGGSSEGKLNLNNPLTPHPFELNISGVKRTPPQRTAPLEALFYGLRTSISYAGSNPEYVTIDQAQAAVLRTAIQKSLVDNGPFLFPGQLAEITEINDYTYTGVSPKSQSRNDLMREVIGATTTQSNVFSIWVVTQTIQKKRGSLNPGVFEPGDIITGETRRRYVVERFIETGRDGVPGNATKPGTDKVIGTADDPLDANYHPSFPSYPLPYRWRIVSVSSNAA